MNPNYFLCFSVTVATSTAPAATCWWTWRSQIQTCSSSEPEKSLNPGTWRCLNPGTWRYLNPGDIWILEHGDLWILEHEDHKPNRVNNATQWLPLKTPGDQFYIYDSWNQRWMTQPWQQWLSINANREHFELWLYITRLWLDLLN